jgi:hypothetical protein
MEGFRAFLWLGRRKADPPPAAKDDNKKAKAKAKGKAKAKAKAEAEAKADTPLRSGGSVEVILFGNLCISCVHLTRMATVETE